MSAHFSFSEKEGGIIVLADKPSPASSKLSSFLRDFFREKIVSYPFVILININFDAEDGGLFSLSETLKEIVRKGNFFIVGICAFPRNPDWVDWLYAVGFDGVIFYYEKGKIENHIARACLQRALKIFPDKNVGVIGEGGIEDLALSEFIETSLGEEIYYFFLPVEGKKGMLYSLFRLNEKGEKGLSWKLKKYFYKMRRSLRVREIE